MRAKLLRQPASAGFTLIEVLAVVIIMGILAAIAAPGWIAFANSREANQLADQVFQRIRQSQTDAGRLRSNQVVEFNDGNPPVLSYGAAGGGGRNTELLGEGRLADGMASLEVFDGNGAEVDSVMFDPNGILVSDGNLPITVAVQVPADGSGSTRCVILKTLLGASELAQGDACTP